MNELIGQIIQDTFHSNICRVEKIDGTGAVNEVYKVSANCGDLIIRLQQGTAALNEYKKEAWCMKQAKKHHLCVPSVLSVNVYEHYAYMIQEFIHGVNGSCYPDQLMVWQKLGEAARLLKEIPVTGFGCDLGNEEDGTFTDLFSPTLDQQIRYNLSQLTDDDLFISLKVYDPDQQLVLKTLLRRLFGIPYEPCLCHGDLSPDNLLIDQDDRACLIDFGCARVHLQHFNWITATGHTPAEFAAFLRGYGLSREAYMNLEPESVLLSLLHHVDTLRWATDRLPQANWGPYIDQAKKAVQTAFARERLSLS